MNSQGLRDTGLKSWQLTNYHPNTLTIANNDVVWLGQGEFIKITECKLGIQRSNCNRSGPSGSPCCMGQDCIWSKVQTWGTRNIIIVVIVIIVIIIMVIQQTTGRVYMLFWNFWRFCCVSKLHAIVSKQQKCQKLSNCPLNDVTCNDFSDESCADCWNKFLYMLYQNSTSDTWFSNDRFRIRNFRRYLLPWTVLFPVISWKFLTVHY